MKCSACNYEWQTRKKDDSRPKECPKCKTRLDRNDKIVYAYVCGDIIHIGHITHLLNSKGAGDKLYVGVLTDEAVMERKQKPVFSFKERMDLIRNLKCVDVVVPQNTYSPLDNIRTIKPDILAESTSHKPEDIKTAEEVMKEIGGRVIVMPYYSEQSSTAIKDKIRNKK